MLPHTSTVYLSLSLTLPSHYNISTYTMILPSSNNTIIHIKLFLTRYTPVFLTLTSHHYIIHLTSTSTHDSNLHLPTSNIQHTFNTLLSLHISFKYTLLYPNIPHPPTIPFNFHHTYFYFHSTKPSTYTTLSNKSNFTISRPSAFLLPQLIITKNFHRILNDNTNIYIYIYIYTYIYKHIYIYIYIYIN